jgi:Zn-dependent peptidase ImmA (M78 family)
LIFNPINGETSKNYMAKRIEANITPQVLIWARETAGFDLNSASKKLKLPVSKITAWEEGTLKPTISQLRLIAKIYRRPFAVFYLKEKPREFDVIHDYRRIKDSLPIENMSNLLLEIRITKSRRENALELSDYLDKKIKVFNYVINENESYINIAKYIRELLGISVENQFGWKDKYKALSNWKEAIENLDVLVFQAGGIPVNEVRGFSIWNEMYPIIVMNRKDNPFGKIFTLLHEFCHLLLKKEGICNDFLSGEINNHSDQSIEVLCNYVAGAVLVPGDSLLSQPAVKNTSTTYQWQLSELKQLSEQYCVSKEVVLRRLLIIGKTTPDYYKKLQASFDKKPELEKGKKKKGFLPPFKKSMLNNGNPFIKLVLDAYYQEKITANKVSDYLDVRIKHIDTIEKKLIENMMQG